MNRLGQGLLYVGITVVIGAGLSGCFSWENHHRAVSYGIDQPVRTLVIEGATGDISVTGAGTAISVTERQSYRDKEPHTTHEVVDGTLTLSFNCHDCGVGYDVQVPAGTVVRVHDSTGSVRLAGLSAEVQAETETGSIEASGLTSSSVRLKADTGDVSAAFAGDPSTVQTTTSTGNVHVTVPNGHVYAVSASAATGNVNVSLPQQPDAGRSIIARAETGDVTVAGA